jgi:choline dehydrogenase
MNWVRGNQWDYDHWATLSLPTWSFVSVLPYFKAAESFDRGGNAFRGDSGPTHIETCKADNPLFEAFLDAGREAGYAFNDDHNAATQDGFHVTQQNVYRGRRWSASHAYLRESGRRGNLLIETRAHAKRIEVSGRRAVRLHYLRDGKNRIAEARCEIVLCAGALHSPQLLMLSGIGDARHLRELGIRVVCDLPGVGRGLKDHVVAPVRCRITQPVSLASRLWGFRRLKIDAEWMLFKSGLGASSLFDVGGFVRTREGLSAPNIQYGFAPMLDGMEHGSKKLQEGFEYFLILQRPTSAGYVQLANADPLAMPKFRFNYLSSNEEIAQMTEAIRLTRDMIRQRAWEEFRGEEVTPGPSVISDKEIESWLRSAAGTSYHPCCSCRMGVDDMSVVNETAQVHGLDGLRVVDASIMPEIPGANLNSPTIMMAEKLSDAILGRSRFG